MILIGQNSCDIYRILSKFFYHIRCFVLNVERYFSEIAQHNMFKGNLFHFSSYFMYVHVVFRFTQCIQYISGSTLFFLHVSKSI